MKRFFAFVLAAVMVLSFTACGEKDTSLPTDSSAVQTTDKAEIASEADTTAIQEPQSEEASLDEVFYTEIQEIVSGNDKPSSTEPTGNRTEPTSKAPQVLKPAQTDPSKIIVSAKKEMIFTEKPTSSCHASTVLPLDNGNVVAAWFAGSSEKADDVNILTSVRTSKGWSSPVEVTADPDTAHWNPVLFQLDDGTIILYFKVGKEIAEWKTYFSTSKDGRIWSKPQELVPGDTSGGRGPVKNKPIRLSDGTILAPASDESGDIWRSFVDISTDGGKTWNRTDFVPTKDSKGKEVPMIQPTLWQSADGSVHMLTRTKVGKIYRSDSYDGGRTWCTAYPSGLPNNSSGIDLTQDKYGRLFLVYTPHSLAGIRTPLVISVSTDDGKTWTELMRFETKLGEFSYPAIVEKDDILYITYTYKREYIAYWELEIS